MKSLKHFLFLTAVLFTCLFVKANNGETGEKKSVNGRLHGYVLDAVTKKPVTGVTVSITSNRTQVEKEVRSDAAGYFHFAKLPPGEVTLMFEKKGYKIFRRDVLPVKERSVTKISIDFQPIDEDRGYEMWHPLLKILD